MKLEDNRTLPKLSLWLCVYIHQSIVLVLRTFYSKSHFFSRAVMHHNKQRGNFEMTLFDQCFFFFLFGSFFYLILAFKANWLGITPSWWLWIDCWAHVSHECYDVPVGRQKWFGPNKMHGIRYNTRTYC